MDYKIYYSIASVGPSLGLRIVEFELINLGAINAEEAVHTLLSTLENIDPELRVAALCGNIPIMFVGNKETKEELTSPDARILIEGIMDAFSRLALDLQVHGQKRETAQLKPPYFGLVTYAPHALVGDALFYDNFNQIHVYADEANDDMALTEIVRHPFSVVLVDARQEVPGDKVKAIHGIYPSMRTFLIVDQSTPAEVLENAAQWGLRTGIRPQMTSPINQPRLVFPVTN